LWENAGPVEWMSAPAGVLAFARGGTQCWVNTSTDDVELPGNFTVALSSTAGVTRRIPPDTAVWVVEG
jgi:alpha-glucosidase